jgi:DNA-binding transcriptional LysR family regulator
MEALDDAKRRWRLAFVGHSLAAVESIAAQGLAVTVVKRGTFPSRLRPLTERDGMPLLPAADICLHRAANLSRAGALLADHLRVTISDEVALPRSYQSVRLTERNATVDGP